MSQIIDLAPASQVTSSDWVELFQDKTHKKMRPKFGGRLTAASLLGNLYITDLPDSVPAPAGLGQGSVDLNFWRYSSSYTASGDQAFCVGHNAYAKGKFSVGMGYNGQGFGYASIGLGGFASGAYSFAGPKGSALADKSFAIARGTTRGYNSVAFGGTASKDFSFTHGANAVAYNHGERVFSSGSIGLSTFAMFGGQTTDATPKEIFLDSGGTERYRINNYNRQALLLDVFIIATRNDGSAVYASRRRLVVKNNSGTLALVNQQLIGTDYNDPTTAAVTFSVDSPTASLRPTVTGVAAQTWYWHILITGCNLGSA